MAKDLQTSKLKVLLGYSRFLQAVLSLSQPALAAVIAADGLPSMRIIIIGLIAATAGNLSVFSLNDFLDVELDKKRFANLRNDMGFDIDSAFMRHPLAQGYLNHKVAILWTLSLGIVALILAYLLNPICSLLFILSVSLEIVYCKLAKVTHWKFLVSGIMVSLGAVAGWFAVAEKINLIPIAVFFLWISAWEIGGRNIVNDWSDVEEDQHLGIKTVPLIYGYKKSAWLTLIWLIIAVVSSLLLALWTSLNVVYVIGSAAAGIILLIKPAIDLLKKPEPQVALILFNKASLYPFVMLTVVMISFYYKIILQ